MLRKDTLRYIAKRNEGKTQNKFQLKGNQIKKEILLKY